MPVYTPEKIQFGIDCPDFTLPGVDGRTYSKKDFLNNKPLVVVFMCNHCPYVKAIEDRLIVLAQDLKELGVNMVGICSNDAESYPDDSFENLQKRAKEKNYPFTYLYDETQEVARQFGAICTPDYFVYDKKTKLAYRGRLDDSWKEPGLVQKRELYDAVIELAQDKSITHPQTPSMGCSIKWKK